MDQSVLSSKAKENTKRINDFIIKSGVGLSGIANLDDFKGINEDNDSLQARILKNFSFAIVLGLPFGLTEKN